MCATLGGAPPTARPSKCLIACVARARSGAPTHTAPQKRHARELSTRRDASRDPFALKRCVLQNMRHLKTLGRATNLSSIKIYYIERHTGREWRNHPHMHTKHSACLLWPRPNASLDPFALKMCSQHTAPPRARTSLGRASNLSPIKRHHVERCTRPEWRAHAHMPVGTLRTRALAMPKACREPFAAIWCSHQWHLS
jgi:hypothetical protein